MYTWGLEYDLEKWDLCGSVENNDKSKDHGFDCLLVYFPRERFYLDIAHQL